MEATTTLKILKELNSHEKNGTIFNSFDRQDKKKEVRKALTDFKQLQASNERLQSKIDLALKELAHIEGEKNPTEKRVYEALKNPNKGMNDVVSRMPRRNQCG